MDQETRISELEARIAELTELVHGQREPDGAEVVVDEARSSRRGMLKLAGAAAVGAVASTVAARSAAATTDENLVTGHFNNETQQTIIRYGGAVNTVQGPAISGTSNSMLKIDATLSPSTSTVGLDVIGRGTGANISSDATGANINGTTGLFVIGTVDYGVLAFGGNYGLASSVTTKANLWLQPNNSFFGTSLKTPPLQRTDAHIVGEIDNVDGDIWTCVAAGTPGSWRKLTGPAAAGSLHLLASPKRVYDSRPPEPPIAIAPKLPLAAGATRTIDCTLNASGVPAAARGLLLNVGVVSASGAGFLSVTPGGTGFTGTSTLNWNGPGVAIANGVTVGAGAGATIDVYAGAGGTDFFVDVFGYYI
jgi:hypothetical protein